MEKRLQNISKRILAGLLVTLSLVGWGASNPNQDYSMELPAKSEMEKMEKMVEELCQDEDKALAAEEMTAKEYCEKMFDYARQAEEKSTKILLLRKAVKAAVKGEDLGLVAKIYQSMMAKNGPYYVLEIFRPSLQFIKSKRYAADKGIAEIAKTLTKDLSAIEEKRETIRTITKKFGDKPVDDKPRRQLVNAYMVIGDWKRALELVAMGTGKTAEIAQAEQKYPDGDMPALSIGDYWWEQSEKSKQESMSRAFAAHAAVWYSVVLGESELSELKRKLIEGRVKSVKGNIDDDVGGTSPKVKPGKEVWLIKTSEGGKGETWMGFMPDYSISWDEVARMSTDGYAERVLKEITLPAVGGDVSYLRKGFPIGTVWSTIRINIRKMFVLPCDASKISEARIRYAVDDCVYGFLNGEKVFEYGAVTNQKYFEAPLDISKLRKGENYISIHAYDKGGALHYIDFGLRVKYK